RGTTTTAITMTATYALMILFWVATRTPSGIRMLLAHRMRPGAGAVVVVLLAFGLWYASRQIAVAERRGSNPPSGLASGRSLCGDQLRHHGHWPRNPDPLEVHACGLACPAGDLVTRPATSRGSRVFGGAVGYE